jgi:hypothetical protein
MFVLAGCMLLAVPPALAQDTLRVGFVSMRVPVRLPATFLDPPPEDEGIQGARLGMDDNATTGRFTGQRFALEERPTTDPEAALDAFRGLVGGGVRLILADVRPSF